MLIRVLGSGAGGGLPQWNCRCPNCDGARRGAPWIRPRTQSSIAVSADGHEWVLINASPDVRAQLAANPDLQPSGDDARGSRMAGIVLTDAQIDHATGLLTLREGEPLTVHATASVLEALEQDFPVLGILDRYCGVERHTIAVEAGDFGLARLALTPVTLGGKGPPYSPQCGEARADRTIALVITDTASGKSLFYAPGLDHMDEALTARMATADCLLVDGTFWSDDELPRTGTGRKTAAEMGHLPLSGADGLLRRLEHLQRPPKYLIHINNTNPILDERSRERRAVEAAGVTVTHDGMAIEV